MGHRDGGRNRLGVVLGQGRRSYEGSSKAEPLEASQVKGAGTGQPHPA